MPTRPDPVTLHHGRYIKLVEADGWEYVERHHPVVVAIAVTPRNELLLVEQFRVPVGKSVIELPAGLVGDEAEGESLELAARRELEEETGWRAGRLTPLLQCPTSAGLTSETVKIFRAHELVRVGEGGGDGNEQIIVHAVALKDIDQWLLERDREGKAIDPKIYAALYWIKEKPATDR